MAAIAAHRHSNSHVVTASVDHVDFRNPIRVGELIILHARVNRAFHTSMEIGVKVFSETYSLASANTRQRRTSRLWPLTRMGSPSRFRR